MPEDIATTVREQLRLAAEASSRQAARLKEAREANSEDRALELRLITSVEESLAKLHAVEEVALGHWVCKNSIIKLCYYDSLMDPLHDVCLVCEEPEERK